MNQIIHQFPYGHDSHLASLDKTYGVGAAMENMGGDAWQSSDPSPGPWIQHSDIHIDYYSIRSIKSKRVRPLD